MKITLIQKHNIHKLYFKMDLINEEKYGIYTMTNLKVGGDHDGL